MTNKPPDVAPARRELLVRGAKFNYERLTYAGPDGIDVSRECVRHPGAVIILPLLHSQEGPRLVMIRNWRFSVESWLYELPAGTLEPGEDPAACAARELSEETGYEAVSIRPLCRFLTSPGLSDELMHAYIATDLRHVGQHLEADERVTVHPTPIGECLDMVRAGAITDAKTMLTLLWAHREGLLDQERVAQASGL
jgi:ADP-ribose pyrophosphatase